MVVERENLKQQDHADSVFLIDPEVSVREARPAQTSRRAGIVSTPNGDLEAQAEAVAPGAGRKWA